MMPASEIHFLQRRIARFDDQQAYKELFTNLYSYLFHFARSLVKEKEAAEEIVSDVFIKVWEKRQDLEKIENLKVYLYVSTRNRAFNHLEKQTRNATEALDGIPAELTSVYLDPEQLLITADMLALIQKAIDRLPAKCRMIFKLVKDDCLKYREVAEILGVSIKTVENQLAIALYKIGRAISFDIHATIPSSLRQ